MNAQTNSRNSPKHQRGADKVSRIPIKVEPTDTPKRKPKWIRAIPPKGEGVKKIRQLLRENKLATVCEEAACPNLGECFSHGTATFMILGDICTRRCPFCDVAHGKPEPVDPQEAQHLAEAVQKMKLRHVVITSVDRDDLRDGGATHYADCISALRKTSPETRVEVLIPDFRGRLETALQILTETPPDILNHNIETVPRLYKQCRPGADYQHSLELLKQFRKFHATVPTKSGLMLGLGETMEEVKETMTDLRANNVEMLTLGQYLQPSLDHLPVDRYVTPQEFDELRKLGGHMGFTHVASGPMVRSSYHADLQADSQAGVSAD